METIKNSIICYDNLLDASYRDYAYSFMTNSLFKIGWQDSFSLETSAHKYMHSAYSHSDIENLGILGKIEGSDPAKLLSEYSLVKSVVNLSVPSDVHFSHTHRDQVVLLYYANLQWSHEWAGETLFYDENCSDIRQAISYKPGRLLLFDGNIPHSIRPQSANAPHYRFTLSMIFSKM
jgi:Rps23 Pro-64 3,4-dihydroxylase Tpa1-like proline 4-hydroxylase